MTRKLVIFDVDGTLVDSQADILASMTAAFEAVDHPAPGRAEILSIVGLSLDHAIARLAPDLPRAAVGQAVDAYKDYYVAARAKVGAAQSSPLFSGARAALDALRSAPDIWMGIATGKSRRGLDHLLTAHDLSDYFVSAQVSDDHPSKPHPSMIETILTETDIAPEDAVMIGDTTYDMDMALAADVPFFGVSWGYHAVEQLHRADRVLEDFAQLPGALRDHWGQDV